MISKDTDAAYAFWTSQDQSFTVHYSLDLFHEIDFQVSEGFRRIPYGGIEVGGLLFGAKTESGIRLQAFRLIGCEHASGPGFNLSERDLSELEDQIRQSRTDPDLNGLELIGWFIAHTRTALQMTDREVELFDKFFPGPCRMTVLVKPEKFQATRFAFLFRTVSGELERDGMANQVILPLPGRSARAADSPVPSIAAPGPKGSLTPRVVEAKQAEVEESARASDAGTTSSQSTEPGPSRDKSLETPPEKTEKTRPRQRPPAPSELTPALTPDARESRADTVLTSLPSADFTSLEQVQQQRARRAETNAAEAKRDSSAYFVRLLLVLLLAASLGCGAGYWAYLQLPPLVIPLSAKAEANGLVVSWPVEQTRTSDYAAVRINDGPQQPLSSEERAAGTMRIPVSGANVKVEVIVHHWIRDSRGIVRLLSPEAAQSGAMSTPR